ncbi:hypothetical protein SDC9_14980 [bioreactor metagenome]|uniref:Uncharacterized protein n=1 Tax=bioreactor metagenome TaxID=1076179 RepID=A0A644TQM0_9ZZZZ|nr:hypothetical protein [Negativicutes bacterium]
MRALVALFVLLNFGYFYFRLPVLAFGFTDWSVPVIALGLIFLFVPLLKLLSKFQLILDNTVWGELLKRIFPQLFTKEQQRQNVINISRYQKYGWLTGKHRALAISAGILLVVGVANTTLVPVLTSLPLFYNQSYRTLLGEVKESSFSSDVEPINLSQIRIVDEETAIKLAEKQIGEVPALGSEVQLGTMELQKVSNKLYYVGPLEHRGIFQWLSNYSRGSKGFVMVSATNPQDVRLVQTLEGRDIYLKYQTKGFVMDYLPRYLYFHGIVNVGMADFSFEVDDALNPYWVVTLYKNKVGYAGGDAVGVATVNAETGQINRYSLDNIPQWIDRVHPEAFVFNQILDWGQYINGFWNTLFAKTGTLKPADDQVHLIYGNDDSVYWYTGITSFGRDESTVGFIMVNSRTKEAKWYKVAGANETSARKSAEGQVQEKGYRAGYPVLYNINGVPTYIAPLKDKEGLLKSVAFVSVENYNLVGVGPDIESALRSYRQSLASRGNLFIPGNESKQLKVNGRISRISSAVKGGESYIYFMLEGDPRIFVGTINTSPKLPLAQVGDTITVGINDTPDITVNVSEFKGESY